jgi:two-component system response regulator DesR
MTVRLLLAEDVRLLRDALVAFLNGEPDLAVVAAVERGDAIVSFALDHRPDVALIDVDLPGLDGICAAAELRRVLPDVRVIILTGLVDVGHVSRALDANVSGFVPKDVAPRDLAVAIRTAAAGGLAIDPGLTLAAWHHRHNPLTRREREVLALTAQGAAPQEIASRLHLSAGTVRNYLTAAVTKLNAKTRVDAVRIAGQAGWLP